MRKLLLILIFSLFLPASVAAQSLRITDFEAEIAILQNTRIKVTETVQVVFLEPLHGIYRTIPVTYAGGTRRINSKVQVLSVTDQTGNPYDFETSRDGNSLRIKIGDAHATIFGPATYVITYEARNIVQNFSDHDELYLNVTGSQWDIPVEQSRVTVTSDYADISMVDCFAGVVGQTQQACVFDQVSANQAAGYSEIPVGMGEDFTIVVGLAQPNTLVFPSLAEKLWDSYAVIGLVFIPALFMSWMWWSRGRDNKYVSDNVYMQPENQKTKTVTPFAREHLPNVYGPIKNLTPAEAGTIIDQKVDIADLVAEIMELARLKYLQIHKLGKKKGQLFGGDDYLFIRTSKPVENLKAHQAKLLLAIANPAFAAAPTDIEKAMSTKEAIVHAKNAYLLSKMQTKFYGDLNKFREDLYTDLTAQGIFSSRPDKTKTGWIVGGLIFQFVLTQVLLPFEFLVLPFGVLSAFFVWLFASHMPRRTAWGYALYRQLIGLQYFVGKGKWRYDIAEKKLFLEEILPLAISLGVVSQLSNDMAGLQLAPPEYSRGISLSHLHNFQSTLGSVMSSTPTKSSSSWSGGSGFGGGGSSGGGGGGGGGGGW